jgi:SPP1 gp7 family putative phage head morphogenesis protein
VGLHQRYAQLLGDDPQTLSLSKEQEQIRKQLSGLFDGMMRTLYSQKGSEFRIEVLAEPKVQEFINAHAGALDSTFKQVEMSDAMRKRLQRSDYIFSGMKTFHELNETFPSLLDSNGNRKTFEAFLNDVRKIDNTYNSNYLRAEYNFVQSSAEMAAKWERFSEDGDRYNLQYRTAGDGKVRPEHAALNGVTLPPSDPFWEEYYPPNGWNCRCTVVQVRRSKYPATPHDEAMALGEEALQLDTKGIFHFNPGKEYKTVPDYNPYTIRRCRDCDIAKGKIKLARFVPENELCQACLILHRLRNEGEQRRLTNEERKSIQESAVTWADKHLPKVTMPDGTTGARLTVQTKEGVELHVGKKFFTETYSKCKNSRRVAETMEIATRVNEWIRDAEQIRIEPGRHHAFDFVVFKAVYNNQEIEFKAKSTEGLIVYMMRLL